MSIRLPKLKSDELELIDKALRTLRQLLWWCGWDQKLLKAASRSEIAKWASEILIEYEREDDTDK